MRNHHISNIKMDKFLSIKNVRFLSLKSLYKKGRYAYGTLRDCAERSAGSDRYFVNHPYTSGEFTKNLCQYITKNRLVRYLVTLFFVCHDTERARIVPSLLRIVKISFGCTAYSQIMLVYRLYERP